MDHPRRSWLGGRVVGLDGLAGTSYEELFEGNYKSSWWDTAKLAVLPPALSPGFRLFPSMTCGHSVWNCVQWRKRELTSQKQWKILQLMQQSHPECPSELVFVYKTHYKNTWNWNWSVTGMKIRERGRGRLWFPLLLSFTISLQFIDVGLNSWPLINRPTSTMITSKMNRTILTSANCT